MKQPLAKLISVYRELDDYPGDGLGHVIDGIVDYLDGCKCCAFCKNYGKYDPCESIGVCWKKFFSQKCANRFAISERECILCAVTETSKPNNKYRDFEPCDCAWFSDKRDDEQYRLPNGTVHDFYKTIELG